MTTFTVETIAAQPAAAIRAEVPMAELPGVFDRGFPEVMRAVGVQGIINTLVKTMVGRPRPSSDLVEVLREVSGNSFPSGHVMFYTVFFGLIFFLALTRLPRTLLRWIVLLVSGGLVVLIGPSRIFLGAHWLSDVVAGYLLSFVLLGFAIEFHLRYLGPVVVKEKAKGTPPPDRVEP